MIRGEGWKGKIRLPKLKWLDGVGTGYVFLKAYLVQGYPAYFSASEALEWGTGLVDLFSNYIGSQILDHAGIEEKTYAFRCIFFM